MEIQKLELKGFRNFETKSLRFSSNTTLILGPNASGKTNILESLYYLSTGKSFRAGVEKEMINYRSGLARIKGVIGHTDLEAVLTRGTIEVGEEKIDKVPKKKLLVNGISKRLVDFAGNFKTVLFGPWDMDLVTGSPSIRREFLDSVLSQVDREYRRAKLSYEKGLRQRNRILWDLRENPLMGKGRERLLFWDKLIIKNGDYMSGKRQEFVDYCNELENGNEGDDHSFSLVYDKSAISEARLLEYAKEEVAAAMTLVGPHRDDIQFLMTSTQSSKKRDLATYGSRGEQRMGILWVKLCELLFIEAKTEDKPTLLLDDIFSELDHNHRDVVMRVVSNQQTIITTADEHFIEGLPDSSIIKLTK